MALVIALGMLSCAVLAVCSGVLLRLRRAGFSIVARVPTMAGLLVLPAVSAAFEIPRGGGVGSSLLAGLGLPLVGVDF